MMKLYLLLAFNVAVSLCYTWTNISYTGEPLSKRSAGFAALFGNDIVVGYGHHEQTFFIDIAYVFV